MIIELKGRIDSNNASQVETDISRQLAGKNEIEVILDAAALDLEIQAGL